MKFSEKCQNISFYWLAKLYLIIFKIDKFIAKTKRVSVQLGHSVVLYWRQMSLKSQAYSGHLEALEFITIYAFARPSMEIFVF